jgi:hypothetical protein
VSSSICPDHDSESRQVSGFIECLVSSCIVLSQLADIDNEYLAATFLRDATGKTSCIESGVAMST